MARSKDVWVGATDDSVPPAHVQLRVIRSQDHRCPICTRPLKTGNIACDHKTPLEDGGRNDEANLQMICIDPCHYDKTGRENSRRSKADRSAKQHYGLKKRKGRPMPGTKASGWKQRMDGTWERR